MISLIIPPRDQISRVAKMLGDEYGTVSNIKSRVNRLSVLGGRNRVQQPASGIVQQISREWTCALMWNRHDRTQREESQYSL